MLPLLLLALIAPQTYTVDDNGPADFASLSAAVDAVPAGSTLLVEVGDYGGFTLDKRLTILGHEGPFEPFVGSEPYVGSTVTVVGASRFTLAGMRLSRLVVQGVPGRGIVDDCTVLDFVEVSDCAQVSLSRLVMPGAQEDRPAVDVDASRVTLVDCDLVGGPGLSIFAGAGFDGRPALQVRGGSFAVVAGSRLVGGNAGLGTSTDGSAGDGLLCLDSTVIVRGSTGDLVDDGVYEAAFGGTPGHSVSCYGGLVFHSGADLPAGVFTSGGGIVAAVAPDQPYVEITGGDVPGEARSLDLYGPAGTAGLLLFSLSADLFSLPVLESPLWVDGTDLLAVIPFGTLGQDLPLSITLTLPTEPGLEGLVLHVQPVFPGASGTQGAGTLLVGNEAPLVVRF